VNGPSRRSFLKTGSAAALALSLPGARRALAGGRLRVGIVGGGVAGVSCAWLLDGVADSVLFESRTTLGGHAQTSPVTVGDREIQVDVGAQFFAAATHPTYTRLVEILGLLDPGRADQDATVEADMTITVTEAGAGRPRFWSAFNADRTGDYCEGSIWYGALRPVPPGKAPLSLFKSWATARGEAPREEVFRQAFRHPYITPAFIAAQRRLDVHQGRGGVWFAGSYTGEVDSQETALTSAMGVVQRLDPGAPNLLALQA
jgi:predicted NAD/FAD-binding protein